MEFELKKGDQKILESIANSNTASRREKSRASILLLANKGISIQGIASELAITAPTVKKWITQYQKEGLSDLKDKARPGRPIIYTEEIKAKLLDKLNETPPDSPYWSGDMLSKELNIPLYAVMNILHKENISLVKIRKENLRKQH